MLNDMYNISRCILMSDGTKISKKEDIDYNSKECYTYFLSSNNKIVLNRVNSVNIDYVQSFLFIFEEDSTYVCNPYSGKIINCSEITDEYNSRVGRYSKYYTNSESSPTIIDDIYHIDGNVHNNNPSNISRVGIDLLPLDYFRKISDNTDYREVSKYLYNLIDIKNNNPALSIDELLDKYSTMYDDTKYISKESIKRLFKSDNIYEFLSGSSKNKSTSNNSSKGMKVYIASGFFCNDDRSLVAFLESFLEKRGYSVYSPSRDGIILKHDSSLEDRLRTYEDNVKHVKDSDLLIVCVNNKDTGTSVELGLKAGMWEAERSRVQNLYYYNPTEVSESETKILEQETPRIITFSDNNTEVNVMLLGAVLKHCKSWDELTEYLDYVDSVGIENARRNTKSVEDVNVY